jgi:beta-barrel assembly-enhancing protease
MGTQVSACFEKSITLLRDSMTDTYLDRLGQVVARNSDAQLPITIRVIDSENSYALTLLGGHQYLTRGLLLQLQDECELAAAIARGVAHTALRSATGELTRFNLINLTTAPTISVSVPPIFVGVENGTTDTSLGIPLTGLHYRRLDESAADYFGIEYLYKSGYAPECFISFVRKAWPFSGKTTAKAFSPFPPLPERLDALQRDIKEILPKPSGAITDTEEFESFRKHLVDLPPPKPSPKQPNPFAPIRKHSIDW